MASEATLVDTNVLLDLVTDDPRWADWSMREIERAALRGRLVINDVIYAELSVRFAAIEALDDMVAGVGLSLEALPRPALFLAGKAFLDYRRRGGGRHGVLPDFFIGAHAAVAGLTLLTRDAGRYRGYFPTVEVMAPG